MARTADCLPPSQKTKKQTLRGISSRLLKELSLPNEVLQELQLAAKESGKGEKEIISIWIQDRSKQLERQRFNSLAVISGNSDHPEIYNAIEQYYAKYPKPARKELIEMAQQLHSRRLEFEEELKENQIIIGASRFSLHVSKEKAKKVAAIMVEGMSEMMKKLSLMVTNISEIKKHNRTKMARLGLKFDNYQTSMDKRLGAIEKAIKHLAKEK